MKNYNTMNHQKGSVVVYLVLLIFVLMTSAAIVLSTILNRHIKASENYLISEQAFSAANTSVEHMLYDISKQAVPGDVESSGSITYESGAVVTYTGEGCGKSTNGVKTSHVEASGEYKGAVRRIEYGGGSDECD